MFSIYLLVLILITNSNAFPADEVTALPGLTEKPTFRQYSGYLNISDEKYLHYWFTESQSNPSTDPVVLWLNGGPGCSSLTGLLTENGPFRVNKDGKTLSNNPFSWNTVANVIYLESPVAAGYSYTTNNTYINTDESTAEDNYVALLRFFEKFPQFINNSFYITGESYAGVFIPMLAVEVFQNKNDINLKGLAIGNGALNYKHYRGYSINLFTYTHGMQSLADWKQKVQEYCTCDKGEQICDFDKHKETLRELSPLLQSDPYNVYKDCPMNSYATEELFQSSRLYNDLKLYFGFTSDEIKLLAQISGNGSDVNPACIGGEWIKYLNSPDVRKALHIPTHLGTFGSCSGCARCSPGSPNMTPYVKQLIDSHKIENFIVYNGDFDTVCDFISDQKFVEDLGYKVVEKFKSWTAGDRVGGYYTKYEGITFMTVRAAGHMVPTDQPEAALEIFRKLIGLSK